MLSNIFSEGIELGYYVVGTLAFILGCAVTVFCFKLRKLQHHEDDEEKK